MINASRMLTLCYFLALLFGLWPLLLFSQEHSVKWGEIPRANLEMTTFAEDSNAKALILEDIGKVTFDAEFNMIFERHRRVKILSQGGYDDWGTVTIPYYAVDRWEQVRNIEGQTFSLAEDGSVRRTKLESKPFDEDMDGRYRMKRFTFPALTPGCVVEYRYKKTSQGGQFLEEWDFQNSEPTLWSEFSTEIPEFYQYVMVYQQIPGFYVEESQVDMWPVIKVGGQTPRMVSSRWALHNVPALRDEPFITTLEDYRSRIRFQLAKFSWQGMVTPYMDTWEKLAEQLMDSDYFGRQIERHKILRQQAETVAAGLADPVQKVQAIYDYVHTTMTWNGINGIYVDEDLDKAFKARRGGCPEIALMLTGMLRFAGLEAYPVLISTRSHGRVVDLYPILTQFNYVLTHVKVGAREYLLDATDPLRPHTILPVAALNQVGWMVDKKNLRWVNIVSPGFFINHTIVSAALNEDGSISGWLESSDEGYSGLFDRHTLEDKKEEEYIKDGWLKNFTGARLDSFKISNRDSIGVPLITKAYFSSSDYVQIAGDNLYINPVFFGRQDENPLKLPKRTFPVDYAYGRKLTYQLNLMLPEGYTVLEAPKNVVVNLPNNSCQFKRLIQVTGNIMQIVSQLVIDKTRFQPSEYNKLREFYDRIVAVHAEQVVLKRNQ